MRYNILYIWGSKSRREGTSTSGVEGGVAHGASEPQKVYNFLKIWAKSLKIRKKVPNIF